VISKYPAYIVARLYISWGRGIFGLSRRHFILQALFVVFLLKSTAAHSRHIQHL
jgi:hypothetical protein